MTPSKNINRLLQDLARVADIKFRLGLYSRYLRIVAQASITPNPISNSLCSKIANFSSIPVYKRATNAPNT